MAIRQLSEQLMPRLDRAIRMVVRKPEGDQGDPAGRGPAIAIGRAEKVTVTRRAERACPARFRATGRDRIADLGKKGAK